MDTLELTVAERLRAVMAEFDIVGNRAMGEACGATPNQVNSWLLGYNPPRVPEMTHLCEHTRLTLDWLYRGHMGAMDAKLGIRLTKRMASRAAASSRAAFSRAIDQPRATPPGRRSRNIAAAIPESLHASQASSGLAFRR